MGQFFIIVIMNLIYQFIKCHFNNYQKKLLVAIIKIKRKVYSIG